MFTENLSTLKIHKLTKAQYERELAAGNIDENALYLTPDDENSGGTQLYKHTIDDGFVSYISTQSSPNVALYSVDYLKMKYTSYDVINVEQTGPTTYNLYCWVSGQIETRTMDVTNSVDTVTAL
jgi:hypothetical protein